MSDNSTIEWTQATWNPMTGCEKVSPGCDNCYAETFSERFRSTPGHYFERGFDLQLRPDKLTLPLRWRKPKRIFVNSMSDLFHKDVPDEYIARVFAVMASTPQHSYQLLTKRHGRMRSLLSRDDFAIAVSMAAHRLFAREGVLEWPLRNVWVGISVEDQQRANLRIPALLDTPAAVRWLSCEPLLGPVDLSLVPDVDLSGTLGWVVVGGESGPKARPMHPDWARALRDQCTDAGIPFFFKQWGEHVVREQMTDKAFQAYDAKHGSDVYPADMQWRVGKKLAGRELDGRTWDQYPAAVEAVSTQ